MISESQSNDSTVVVEREAADGVPHLAAHQQKVAAGIGMQVADVPLRRVRHPAVPRAVQALETGEQRVVVQILEIAGGER